MCNNGNNHLVHLMLPDTFFLPGLVKLVREANIFVDTKSVLVIPDVVNIKHIFFCVVSNGSLSNQYTSAYNYVYLNNIIA